MIRFFALLAAALLVLGVGLPAHGAPIATQPTLPGVPTPSGGNNSFNGLGSSIPAPRSTAPSPTAGQLAVANAALELAADALKRNDLIESETKFAEAAHTVPTAPNGFLGLAEVARRRGDAEGVKANLRTALDVAPDSADANAAWGRYLLTQKDYKGAIARFDKALAVDPARNDLHVQKGDIYASALHDPSGALTSYKAALAIDPKDAGVQYALGNVFLAMGNAADAVAHLRISTELQPDNPLGLAALGTAQMRTGDFNAALAAFSSAVRVQPNYLGAYLGRADALLQLHKNAEAIDAYNEALRLSPHSSVVLTHLAMAEEQAELPADAEKTYRAAVAAGPRDPDALNGLAYFLANEKRDLDNALVFAQRAVALAPDAPGYIDTLAWVYRARGDLPAAAKLLQPVAIGNPVLLYHLGVVKLAMGNKDDALNDFEMALKISPDYEDALKARKALE